jgi:WD40 repeat protein
MAFSHYSKFVSSRLFDDTVKIWDIATGALNRTIKGHRGTVYSVAFSHDSKLVASGSYDDTVKIWDVPCADRGLSADAQGRDFAYIIYRSTPAAHIY